MKRKSKLANSVLIIGLAASLSACGSMRSYQGEMKTALAAANEGRIDDALASVEANNSSEDKDLLYHLEKGQLLRLKGDLQGSVDAWLKADEKIRVWEEESKLTTSKAAETAGSLLINDKVRRYDGEDYEKVMLSTMLTLDHALSGNYAGARTEIKKTYEREALIASLHEKEYDKVEEEAKENNVQTTFKDLQGYPVETLDDPEVLNLKNGYQSAFSHYLAGYIFESLREPSLASAGYRKAIELRPNMPLLEQGLKGLNSRIAQKAAGTDVLFVVESGLIPTRTSLAIPMPFSLDGKPIITQIAFPVIMPGHSYQPLALQVGDKPVALTPISNFDAMARRALRDEMPGIIMRSTVRAVAKGLAQKELGDQFGALGSLAGITATVLTEQSDERAWSTLPARIAIGRVNLKPGRYSVSVPTPSGERQVELDISGSHAIVPLRLFEQTVIPPQGGKQPPAAAVKTAGI
ncbi:hypothetical protein KIF53_06725 [Chromobacterium subtsugae]|uniref:Lipoprotein n=1 Tax=Chromobacterium subtsugae TaxID=251747 RepID=A0ABS7FD05_9NEIS|nr:MULTISPECIES: hypothetical protein [Chromobacterium]KUM01832.1 hypothetical protein Cv017_06240 [Chromobacterium subtsugae]KZE84511.1 hypothetical protein AWB61_03685 [Chromobacterium sp. F49]MBW7566199.1 hypothetical protein [Chromobacterium subtsugae]MBW8287320.1 hypothetical protein [Chromobacterium subtsugae]WSE90488.1 hypothetical protein U6115_16530 [Chromobacterium subtsugae]